MTPSASTPEFAAARQAMVDSQLRPQGVTDPQVLAAMGSVERERFVPEDARSLAYSDRSVPLGDGRALPPPSALGILLDAMQPSAGERALVIGPGTGYSAAVLDALGIEAIESDGAAKLGGRTSESFDLILFDGAIEFIPDAIVDRLADGGRLGAALIESGVTRLILGRKSGGVFGFRVIGDAAVPPLPGFTRPPAFVF